MMKLRKLDEKQTNKQKGSEFPKRNFRLLVCNFFISLIAAHLQTSFCYVDVKTLTSICIASFQSKSNVEEDVVRLVKSVKKKEKKILGLHEESNPRPWDFVLRFSKMDSEDMRLDSSCELRSFSLFHAREKTKNIFPNFFTELKTYHLSFSINKNDVICV